MNNQAEHIEIHVSTRFLHEQSEPDNGRYAFAYTIEIANVGVESVQLIARHWIITDGNNSVREVKGEGVVGEQPTIAPQNFYRYSSGAILSTRVGTMEGRYQMKSESGAEFDVDIPIFGLVAPGALQ